MHYLTRYNLIIHTTATTTTHAGPSRRNSFTTHTYTIDGIQGIDQERVPRAACVARSRSLVRPSTDPHLYLANYPPNIAFSPGRTSRYQQHCTHRTSRTFTQYIPPVHYQGMTKTRRNSSFFGITFQLAFFKAQGQGLCC